MAKFDCSIDKKNYFEIANSIDKWAKKSSSKEMFKDPWEAALRLVETEFMFDFESAANIPITNGQVGSFKVRLMELTDAIKRGTIDNKFAQFFWQTSHYGKKDPVIGKLLSTMQKSSHTFRYNENRDQSLSAAMFEDLKSESLSRGLTTKHRLKNADKERRKLDEEWLQEFTNWKNGIKGSEEKIQKIDSNIEELVKNTHLQVYEDMITMIEGKGEMKDGKMVWESGLPKIVQEKYKTMTPEKQSEVNKGKRIVPITETDLTALRTQDGKKVSPHMYNAIVKYKNLMDNLNKTLRYSVNTRIESIIKRNKINGNEQTNTQLEEIRKKMQDLFMPKYEQGFFPHYSRDLNIDILGGVPGEKGIESGIGKYFESMQSAVNPYQKTKIKQTIQDIANEMKLYISGHAKRRAEVTETKESTFGYSRDFFNTINNYIFDINRFNYTSFMDSHMLDGLSSVEKIYNTSGRAKGYAESITNYIRDLHSAANGDTSIEPGTRNFMRTVLGFEFISKLGINPRGAARNFTQRALDYIEWGPVQVKRMKKQLDTIDLGGDAESYVTTSLKKAGLLFDDISPQLLESQLQAPASGFKVVNWNEAENKFEFNKTPRMEKVANAVSWAAGKSSLLHRMAENSNRKHTFKLGFAQLHGWLYNPEYRAKLRDREIEKRKEKGNDKPVTEKFINNIIAAKSKNYAINMVVLYHFDYADYAKSKALRSKAGRFLGQFQHYSFEFFERNLRILREATHDVIAGNLLPNGDARGLQKAYRMGLVYFMAPVIASALTGVNFSNLLEHDSAERVKQLATLLTGDEEDIKTAFYGKGPIISTFGGPITSDLIDIGMMLDLIDLDEDSLMTLITGMEKYDPSVQSTELSKRLRIINTFLGRAAERHIPQLTKGRVGWAVQQEFGLYPTKEARKKQKKYKKARKELLPKDIESALSALESGKGVRSFAKGGQFITKGPEAIIVGDNPSGREKVTIEPIPKSKGPSKYNKFDMKNLDTALSELAEIKKREDKDFVPGRRMSLGGPDSDDYA